jgi:hypothetical protein
MAYDAGADTSCWQNWNLCLGVSLAHGRVPFAAGQIASIKQVDDHLWL